MAVTFNYGQYLPEHKDELMRDLVASGHHSTALMLAATCREERARFKRLGYKWAFAAARLCAARHGYLELFKYLHEQCSPYWCGNEEYRRFTLRAVRQTPNIELFRWYVGPGYFPERGYVGLLSWPIARTFFDFLDEHGMADLLGSAHVCAWRLAPYEYIHERFGPDVLRRQFQFLVPLTCYGTVADFVRFGLEDYVTVDRLYSAVYNGNVPLVTELLEKFRPDGRPLRFHWHHLSVPLLELLRQRQWIQGDAVRPIVRNWMEDFVITTYGGDEYNLTGRQRALITYAGWTLPDDIATIRQCWNHLFPEKKLPSLLPTHSSFPATPKKTSYVNAL